MSRPPVLPQRRPEDSYPPPRYDSADPREQYSYARAQFSSPFDDRHISMVPTYESQPTRFPPRPQSRESPLQPRQSLIEEIARLIATERELNPPLGLYAGPEYDLEEAWD